MTQVVDLHPEELLDRDARGELSALEETRLQAHLARCPACRFERQLRMDFADELESDLPSSLPSVERLALAGVASPKRASVPDLAPPLPPELTTPRRRPARRVSYATWLFAAAALLGVSVAGATSAGQRAWSRLVGISTPTEAPAVVEGAPSHVAAKRGPHHLTAPAPTVADRTEPRPQASTIDVLVSAPAAPPAPERLARPVVEHRAVRGGERDRAAAALFESAAEARRQGSYARAIDLQRELLARFPHSRESHVARETLGRLLLDRGDPSGAFESFDAYLAEGSGELGEEAMVGRATALERLGRTAQAADAWRGLLAAYPESPYAAHARSRLGTLSLR